MPAKAGNCFFKARGFSPVALLVKCEQENKTAAKNSSLPPFLSADVDARRKDGNGSDVHADAGGPLAI